MKNNIFIVGVGRSGTSLLQSMLNAHSNIVSLPETQFFRKYIAKKNICKTIEKKGAKNFIKTLQNDDSFQRLGIKPSELKTLNREVLDVVKVYNEIMETYTSVKQKEYLVDKDPRNLDYISSLVAEIRDIKIVHIIRDPRDIVLSKTKAKWSQGRPYWLHALLGEAQLYNSSKIISKLSKANYLEIFYEDLISKPEKELKSITGFIGVDFQENMLQFGKSARELVSKEEMQWKKETLGPLIKSNSEKWKKEFNANQIALIERVSKKALNMSKYNDSDSMKKTSFITKLKIKLLVIASFFFNKLYAIRIKFL